MNKKGFTTVELMVVLSVFSLSVLIIIETFMLANRSQRKILEQQKLHSDLSYTLETIARAVRLGSIDYAYYSNSIINPLDELYLSNADGGQVVFKKGENQADGCVDDESSPCVILGVDLDVDGDVIAAEGDEFASLTAKGISINNVKFYVTPGSSPFLKVSCLVNEDCTAPGSTCLQTKLCSVPDEQPIVTIVLSANTLDARKTETMNLQTTVSSRAYYR